MPGDVLLLNGSPRPGGNTAWLLGMAGEALAAQGVSFQTIPVASMRIGPCTGCDACLRGAENHCVLRDDMTPLYAKVLASSAILFASPVYWFNYSAQLKLFIDRLYGLWNQVPGCLKDKKIGGLFVYGDSDVYSSGAINAIGSIEHLARFTGARLAGFAYGTANAPGDAGRNPDLVRMTGDLALKLAP